MDPGDPDEPSREDLESRVAELEQTVSKMLPDRRGVLKGLGAAAIGGAAVGASSGGASGQSASGQVGTESNPVDVEGAQGNFDSVSTGEETLTDGLVQTFQNQQGGDPASDVRTQTFSTIQAGIDNISGGAGPLDDDRAFGQVLIYPPDTFYDEAIDIFQKHLALKGLPGQSTVIRFTGDDDHAVNINANDVFLFDLGIDHTGSGSFNGVHTSDTKDENVFVRVSVDAAPQHGFLIRNPYSTLWACEGTGGQTSALRLEGDYSQVVGFKGQNPNADGIQLAADFAYVSGVWNGSAGIGMLLDDGGENHVEATFSNGSDHGVALTHTAQNNYLGLNAFSNANDGLRLDGSSNLIDAVVSGNGSAGVRLQANATNNVLNLRSKDSIIVESGATQNFIFGNFDTQTVTLNGTRTVLNGRGRNSGDPNISGEWNGNASFASKHNVIVEDTTNSNLYIAKTDGNWSQIGA